MTNLPQLLKTRTTRPLRKLAVALAFATLAAGCGSDDELTITDPSTTTTAAAANAAAVEDVPEAPTPLPTVPMTTGPSAVAKSAGPALFKLPSGNIQCNLDPEWLEGERAVCEIENTSYTAPTKPGDCEFDWVTSVVFLGREGAEFRGCVSDAYPAIEPTETLAYGSSAQRGFISCDSATSGVTCRDLRSGKGFFLSKGSYRFF